MSRLTPSLLLIGFLLSAAPACEGSAQEEETMAATIPVPRGSRLLSIDVTMSERKDYEADFALGREVGLEATSLPVFWDDLEPAPGQYAPDPNFLAIANAYYPSHGTKVALMLGAIDTNNARLPPDLAGKPFDDPAVLERFGRLIDYVLDQVPDLDLASLSIGNEIDAYLGTDAGAWAQYRVFFEAARARVKARRPDLLVGAKVTYGGLMGPARPLVAALNEATDVVMVTYYPLRRDFTVKDPSAVVADVEALTAAYPGRPIYLLEAGYPSGAACRSSEEKQAAFIQHFFRAWDAHADQIQLVSFTWLTDVSPADVEELEAYYGLSDRRFAAFLQTLGLRTYEGAGTDKKAFGVLKAEAAARGW